MPSTMPVKDRAKLKVYPALSDVNSRSVIVVAAGYSSDTERELHHFIPWFQTVATVLVVSHPEHGFSYEVEATQVKQKLRRLLANKVYFVGLSMGARLATATIDQFGKWERSFVRGVLPICGINWREDVNGPSAKLWPLMRWPLTAKWFIHRQNVKGDRKNPGPDWEVAKEPMPHHAEAIAYGEGFPADGRRAQIRGIALLEPLRHGAYPGIPMIYLGSSTDQVIDQFKASIEWTAAFNAEGHIIWLPWKATRHCSLNEHPLAWASAIAEAFQSWRVPLTVDTFEVVGQPTC